MLSKNALVTIGASAAAVTALILIYDHFVKTVPVGKNPSQYANQLIDTRVNNTGQKSWLDVAGEAITNLPSIIQSF